ncbi:MAG: NirA family protein [Opitutaceae bacterium]|jgi:ferredoxin-nitrite reductase|nr:NirA family protein [Opitutaceae bacterium]
MSLALPETPAPASTPFRPDQKEYLQGFFAALATTGHLGNKSVGPDLGQAAPAPAPARFHSTPVDDLCQQEKWKHAEHPLDGWERLLAHASADKAPDAEHNYRFRWHGLFHVAPAQQSYMLRLRLPGCSITSHQLHGLADLANELAGGYAHVTTRGNLQLREIKPRDTVRVLMRLAELGLSSRGSGADNLRNITASPDSGFAPDEVLDVRPYALALHHYVINQRDLFDLPRKFNISFDNGGSLSVAADTNDIGFIATRLRPAGPDLGQAAPGTGFRVLLGGITGHKDFARDTGLYLAPDQAVPVAIAMMRVFIDHGDRTNRKKARLKYLLEAKGVDWFLAETAKRVPFPLARVPTEACEPRRPAEKHAWIGARRQREPHTYSLGVGCPVGRLTPKQMHRLADLAAHYGKSELRLTAWQNVLIPHLPESFLPTVERAVVAMGLYQEASLATGGIIACTGSWGCKYASADTKAHALDLIRRLPSRITIDQPVNIHVTGCAHSCAQHYAGDIGFISTKLADGDEGYHLVLGGGMDQEQGIAREIFKGVRATELLDTVVKVLTAWQTHRQRGETFVQWTRRHEVKQLQELLS